MIPPINAAIVSFLSFGLKDRQRFSSNYPLFSKTAPEGNDIESSSDDIYDLPNEIDDTKPSSPLAMAAADWLEDEKDELESYWNHFDAAKSSGRIITDNKENVPIDRDTTTPEQLLERYYKRR
jgi:hypothetical protein